MQKQKKKGRALERVSMQLNTKTGEYRLLFLLNLLNEARLYKANILTLYTPNLLDTMCITKVAQRKGEKRELPWQLSWSRISLQCRRPWFNSQVGKIRWRRDRLRIPEFLGFPCGSAGKESTCNAGGLGSIPGLGRSPGEGKGDPLQYSGLENSMDCIVHRGHGVRQD